MSTNLVSVLWAIVRRPILLGALILGFLGSGILALVISSSTTGWWQDFLLSAGVNLIFVGVVDLLVLGVLRNLIEGGRPASPLLVVAAPSGVRLSPEAIQALNEAMRQMSEEETDSDQGEADHRSEP
ncbi:hypothetical protein [Streptomyces coeruleorubidus]|uniref:ABC transporter permease n=1 Tax=Streptomyces coeruleorubidus TaxID=116188 RepID=A0ABZ0K978_STRC4|nr:hypothetical protein [Streptomyces coeruleorubidus]WOT34245.1 hypothetical protein R5U08_08860 [Streptomyces coeruleorubidus]WOT34272.1 hypothetical protein R5U08_09015 [Streptomyces coeruleorubidus]WOT34296.1 hypothetical protein R5U08_09165 [Streptomyces coeruleorubidus]